MIQHLMLSSCCKESIDEVIASTRYLISNDEPQEKVNFTIHKVLRIQGKQYDIAS